MSKDLFLEGEEMFRKYGWKYSGESDIWTMHGVGWFGTTSQKIIDRMFSPFKKTRTVTISIIGTLTGTVVWEETYEIPPHGTYKEWLESLFNSPVVVSQCLDYYLDVHDRTSLPDSARSTTKTSQTGIQVKSTGDMTQEVSNNVTIKYVKEVLKVRDRTRFLVVVPANGAVRLVWFEPGQTPATHNYGAWQTEAPGIDRCMFAARYLCEFGAKDIVTNTDSEIITVCFPTELSFEIAYRKDVRERQGGEVFA